MGVIYICRLMTSECEKNIIGRIILLRYFLLSASYGRSNVRKIIRVHLAEFIFWQLLVMIRQQEEKTIEFWTDLYYSLPPVITN